MEEWAVMFALSALILALALLVAPIWIVTLLYDLRRRLDDLERAARDGAAPHPVAHPRASAAPLPAPAPVAAPVLPPVPPPIVPPPLPPSTSARTPSSFETTAVKRLHAAWEWVVAGDARQRQGMSFEAAVAANWLTRIGILVLVVGVGFFIKYSIDKGLLGPEGRVALSCLAGAALVGAGVRQFGRQYHILGQGLAGGGLAILYFAVYAAAELFLLVPLAAGFGLMAVVTLTAGVLAVRHRAPLLAVLGTLGGYLTPIMLASDTPQLIWLYGYLLALLAGVAVVTACRGWMGLIGISFLCHNLVFLLMCDGKLTSLDAPRTLPFLALAFVGYSLAAAANGLSGKRETTVIELGGLILAAALFVVFGYAVVEPVYGREAVAWLTLGMGAFYAGALTLLLRRVAYDKALGAALLALGAAALALTLPLVFSEGVLTVSWALLAVAAWWIAKRVGSPLLRACAGLLLVFVTAKLLTADLDRLYSHTVATTHGYLEMLPGRTLNVVIPTAVWLFLAWRDRAWRDVCGYTALVIAFMYLSLEASLVCRHFLPGFTAGAVSLTWGAFAFAIIWGGIRFAVKPLRVIGLGIFCCTVAKVFLHDLVDLESIYRITAFVALGAVLLLAAFLYLGEASSRKMKKEQT